MSWSNLAFTHPWLGLIAFLPVLAWLLQHYLFSIKRPAIMFSDLRLVSMPGTWKTRSIFVPSLCGLIAWLCLSVAMMGPRLGHEETKVTTEGVGISMVIDVSSSMAEEDMVIDNTQISRYDMVEMIFKDFVRGNPKTDLKGRGNDMISLVAFGSYVDDLCPLTLDHDFLLDLMDDKLNSVRKDLQAFFQARQKQDRAYLEALQKRNPIWQSTAIYEGVALGADLLHQSDKSDQAEGTGDYHLKSKVLIVLTDGEDNANTVTVEEATNIAKEFGVKIYSIAIHNQPTQRDLAGIFFSRVSRSYDDSPLQSMAEATGGRFYRASNPESLSQIMKSIDELEKSEISKEVSTDYAPWHRPWLLAGLLFWLASIFLRHTIYRELP